MPRNFTPLRRKIGVMTLVIACLFTAGWVRSLTDQDTVFIHRRRGDLVDNHVLISALGVISWSRWAPIDTNTPIPWTYKHTKTPVHDDDEWAGANVHWHWAWNGFDFGAGSYEETLWMGKPKSWTREVAVWQIPYWSIVTPLTLLSAWLLLSRLRQPKPIPSTSEDRSPS